MQYIFLLAFILLLTACRQQPIQPKLDTAQLTYLQSTSMTHGSTASRSSTLRTPELAAAFQVWLKQADHQQQVQSYKAFLQQHQIANVISDFELLQTARDWQKCAAQEFEVPPREIWSNIVPTLNILKQLVQRGVIQDFSVTSVYRNFNLNRCAAGADSSRHVFNSALDFRIGSPQPSADEQRMIEQSKQRLCQFWLEQGEALQMGLGIYASGQIHIDSAGYRTWGPDHKKTSSPCLNASFLSQTQASIIP